MISCRESKSKLLVSGGLQSEYEKIMADYDSLSIQLADSNLRAEALSNEVDTLKARLSTVIDEYSLQITTLETEKMTLAEEMDLVNTKISSSTKSTEEVDMRNPVHIVTFPDLDSPPRHSVIPDQSSNRKIDSVSVSIQVDPVFVPTLNNSSISSSPPSNFESERDNYLSKVVYHSVRFKVFSFCSLLLDGGCGSSAVGCRQFCCCSSNFVQPFFFF